MTGTFLASSDMNKNVIPLGLLGSYIAKIFGAQIGRGDNRDSFILINIKALWEISPSCALCCFFEDFWSVVLPSAPREAGWGQHILSLPLRNTGPACLHDLSSTSNLPQAGVSSQLWTSLLVFSSQHPSLRLSVAGVAQPGIHFWTLLFSFPAAGAPDPSLSYVLDSCTRRLQDLGLQLELSWGCLMQTLWSLPIPGDNRHPIQ